MKNEPVQLYDVVALTTDLPEHKLRRGSVGTVVELLGNGIAYEVEFADSRGATYASVGLAKEQLMVLHYDPFPDDEAIPA